MKYLLLATIACLSLWFLIASWKPGIPPHILANLEKADKEGRLERIGDNPSPAKPVSIQNSGKVIHVLVALCDNVNQGIVPVPAKIGNGDDPKNNLYWGAGFGVKTHFSRNSDWKLITQINNPTPAILERIVFRHPAKNAWLVADAYRGSEMKQTIRNLLRFASGTANEALELTVDAKAVTLGIGSHADLLAFVGHNGLMDFSLEETPTRQDQKRREVIVLCCYSKNYFVAPLQTAGANPLLLTTGLMAPEAYVLKAATDGWLNQEVPERIRERAAVAYNTYQRCGLKAARNLFTTVQ